MRRSTTSASPSPRWAFARSSTASRTPANRTGWPPSSWNRAGARWRTSSSRPPSPVGGPIGAPSATGRSPRTRSASWRAPPSHRVRSCGWSAPAGRGPRCWRRSARPRPSRRTFRATGRSWRRGPAAGPATTASPPRTCCTREPPASPPPAASRRVTSAPIPSAARTGRCSPCWAPPPTTRSPSCGQGRHSARCCSPPRRSSLATCPLSQPLEIGATRRTLRDDVLSGTLSPQIVLRLGWPPVGPPPPATPRRSFADTATVEQDR